MGRSKHASYSKPQAKTSDIRRGVPGALAQYQAHGPGHYVACNHVQKPDAWDVQLAGQENYYGDSFLTRNLPPSEALMDSAAAFINGVLSDLRAMDTPMLPVAISVDLMDCDPTPDEVMDVDDHVDLDHMNVDVVIPHADDSLSLAAVPMDVAEDPWSMAIVVVPSSTSVPPRFSAYTDYPVTPPHVCPATSPLTEVSAELASVRLELASTNQALQRLTVLALQSSISGPSVGTFVQKAPDLIQRAGDSLFSSGVIKSDNNTHSGLCIDSGVEVVSEGIRILHISDDPALVCDTPLEEPIPLNVPLPEIQPELLSPSSESSGSSQELDIFDTADLLGLDSVEPLHSTPIHDDNGRSFDALGVWADLAGLQLHSLYADLSIRDLLDEDLITFPSNLAGEVVSVFDLPTVDREPRLTEAVDVLPCSEAKVDEIVGCVTSPEISDNDASANAPCEPIVLVLDNGLSKDDGPFVGRISSEQIVQMMKNRAERDARKKARKARTKERRRREANTQPVSEPCSPSAPESLSQMKINVSMPNHSSDFTSPPPRKLARADAKNGESSKQGISNIDISTRPPLHIASNYRLSSLYTQNRNTLSKGIPFSSVEIGKENAPPMKPKTSSPSLEQSFTKEKIRDTKPSALSPSPLSTINQDVQRTPMISTPSRSSINKKFVPTKKRKVASPDSTTPRTPSAPNSLGSVRRLGTTPIEPTTPTPEARVIYLPHTHAMMRQRDKCLTPPLKVPNSCPARISTRPPSPYARDAQPITSQGMGLYSAVDTAPEWIVTEATKKKVLPGAVPSNDYHEDIGLMSPTTAPRPTWLRRLSSVLFGW